jgi:hypothetical protein
LEAIRVLDSLRGGPPVIRPTWVCSHGPHDLPTIFKRVDLSSTARVQVNGHPWKSPEFRKQTHLKLVS